MAIQGWAPEIGDAAALARVIDLAFDYRGDVTVMRTDGREIVGYLCNRNRDVAEPFAQILPASGGAAQTMPYAQIRGVVFSGKDMAAGNSYAAWLKRKEAERSGTHAPGA